MVSDLPRRRVLRLPVLVALVLGLLSLVVLGAGLGSSFMPPGRVLAAALGQGSGADGVILWTLRLPRVALAVLGGTALALAGAILQRVVRNPLAAPSVLGITDGAAIGVVSFLWLFSDSNNNLTVSIHWQPLAAVIGAAGFAAVTAALALADPRRGPLTLILYGVAMAALAKAAVTLLMIIGPIYRAGQAMTWLAGSVGSAHWSDVAVLSTVLLCALPLLVLAVRPLAQLRLDPDSARATGLSLGVSQVLLLLLSVLLTAAAVAFVGAVGFVGLIAPHAARRLVAEGSAAFLPTVALIGGALVLGADILARVIAPPLELPAGAITALLGAPLFLFLLVRRSAVVA
ncbi:iron ABC transporter permease [Roseivivax sp. GX 12232]|uniref:FecCD family ABC transporter permease n=1 Tax=Roseivivax sp. GX 12232 TaxID=2900547 RepID=UPI001E2F9212|nr:iron ABC transporter permease [Roseivivax sp. GX 12232]MCE0505900.1 iron ABC transporter permease [Roseivivax sp. GX 12232]